MPAASGDPNHLCQGDEGDDEGGSAAPVYDRNGESYVSSDQTDGQV